MHVKDVTYFLPRKDMLETEITGLNIIDFIYLFIDFAFPNYL